MSICQKCQKFQSVVGNLYKSAIGYFFSICCALSNKITYPQENHFKIVIEKDFCTIKKKYGFVCLHVIVKYTPQ